MLMKRYTFFGGRGGGVEEYESKARYDAEEVLSGCSVHPESRSLIGIFCIGQISLSSFWSCD